MGDRLISALTSLDNTEWLRHTAQRADPWNKWRQAWVLLCPFAVAEHLAKVNEAEKVERRSTSRKIEKNRKRRAQLDPDGFRAIHAEAPGWLQLAMDLSLVTLQSRKEVCAMRHEHFRDGCSTSSATRWRRTRRWPSSASGLNRSSSHCAPAR